MEFSSAIDIPPSANYGAGYIKKLRALANL
jgi:hypothetical protein